MTKSGEDITLRNVLFFLCLFVRNALFYSYIRERFKTPRLDCVIGLFVTYNDFVTLYHRAPNANQLDGERKPIGLRTQTDWIPNANGLDSEREPIGRRTQTDWTPNTNRLDGGRERYKPATIYPLYNRESS